MASACHSQWNIHNLVCKILFMLLQDINKHHVKLKTVDTKLNLNLGVAKTRRVIVNLSFSNTSFKLYHVNRLNRSVSKTCLINTTSCKSRRGGVMFSIKVNITHGDKITISHY